MQVPGIANATQVSAGGYHSLALLANGTVEAWGANWDVQLGDDSLTNSSTPVQVSGITTATQVAAGGFHSLALLANGTVEAWGANWDGQLGNGSYANSFMPVPVSGLSNVVAIAAGSNYSFALEANGTLWAWGANTNNNPLPNDSTTVSSTPVQVANFGTNVISLASGGGFAGHAAAVVIRPRPSRQPALCLAIRPWRARAPLRTSR